MRGPTPGAFFLLASLIAPLLCVAESLSIQTLQIQGTRRALDLETRAGEVFDPASVERDVRSLWATGWFEDIQVTADESARGMQLTFRVVEKPHLRLRQVRFEPGIERQVVDLEKGAAVDAVVAAHAAAKLQRELVDRGYAEARVVPQLVPVGSQRADLVLKIDRGELYEVEDIRFTGNLGLKPRELRKALGEVRPRRILPSLGPLWGGWRLLAPYSHAQVRVATEKLRSLYLSRGYFDARIDAMEAKASKGKVVLTFHLDSGPRYDVQKVEVTEGRASRTIPASSGGDLLGREFCRCLYRERAECEKRGELGFFSRIELVAADSALPIESGGSPSSSANPSVAVATRIEPGPVYRVGAIEFRGHHAVSDATLRKALVLHEGDLFNAARLRKSLARLNRLAPIKGVDPAEVQIEPDPARRLVNVVIPVKERPRGYWSLDGPLGPLSAFGPLHYTIGSRLPAVGRGPLELSTYYAAFTLVAWPLPLVGAVPVSKLSWGALFTLQRPYVPGQRWQSGIFLSPQLGWRGTAAGYGFTQASEVARSALGGDSVPALGITVPVSWRTRNSGDSSPAISIGVLQCPEPKPRLAWLRTAAGMVSNGAMSWLLTSSGL